MMDRSRTNKLVLISKSDKLKHNKNALPFELPRPTKQSNSVSSRHSDSVTDNSGFIENAHKTRNNQSRELKSYRYPTGPVTDKEDEKFTDNYMRIMSQSVGKNQVKIRVVPQPEQKGFRAASFLSRLLDRARKSNQKVSRKQSYEGSSIKYQLRCEMSDMQGFIPVSKTKKSPIFFQQPAKKQKTNQNVSIQLRKIQRYLGDYLNFIGAPANEHYISNENLSRFCGLKKKQAIQLLDPRIAYATCNILQLIRQILEDQDGNTAKKSQQIKQYCHLYFALRQKNQFQTIVSCSLLQGFVGRLRELFVYFRAALYSILSLCQQHKLFSKSHQSNNKLMTILINIQTAYTIMIQSVIQIRQSVTNNMDSMVNLSFKVLRNMYQVEKQCDQIKIDSKEFAFGKTFSSKASMDIDKNLITLALKSSTLPNFQEKLLQSQVLMNWKFLRIPPIPYLPPPGSPKYTLVLDLDYTLIWYDQPKKVLRQRPGLSKFLQCLCQVYEIVLFTTSVKEYTDRILKQIDPKHTYFRYRLYREHIRIQNEEMVKDISKFGRQLSKIVIVDHTPSFFQGAINNLIKLEAWKGNPLDESLRQLLPILLSMGNKHPQDIRELIKPHRQTLGYISQKEEENFN